MPYNSKKYSSTQKVDPYNPKPRKNRTAREWSKRGKVYGAAGLQLYKDVRKLKSMINVEYKRFDQNHSFITPLNASTPGLMMINNVPPGSTAITRSGNSIKATTLQLRLNINPGTATNESYSFHRILIFGDKQYRSGQTNTQIIEDLLVSSNVNALYDADQEDRFKVYYDKTFVFSNVAGTGGGNTNAIHEDILITLNKHIKFTTSNIEDFPIYVAALTDLNVANHPYQTWFNSRLNFVDN